MNSFSKNFNAIIISLLLCSAATAVTSKLVRQSTFADFTAKDAQSENVIITSDGKINLAREIETLVDDINDVWVINSIAIDSKETVYLGTSPNGAIYTYKAGQLKKIYQPQSEPTKEIATSEPNDPNKIEDANETKPAIANKHIFAMTIDSKDNLIASVSGSAAQLIRFEKDKPQIIFDSNDVKYIFAIEPDNKGNLYIGTGPEGKIYRIDKNNNAEIIYDSQDKNILSLVFGKDGMLYAGADQRGLVYKIDPVSKKASVIYDSDQQEITSLAFDADGNLYAAATSEDVAANQAQNRPQANIISMPGRNQSSSQPPSSNTEQGGLKLQIANTKIDTDPEEQSRKMQAHQPNQNGPASHIYKIDKDGFVTDIYSKVALFFDIAIKDNSIIIGSGNDAELFSYNMEDQRDSLLHQDKTASQVLAIQTASDDIYIATGNPAKLLKVKNTFSETGYFISSVIDAAQPARWGKFQIDAIIPKDATVKLAARSANISEPNDSHFSNWTDPVNINGPTDFDVSKARFAQYKLILTSKQSNKTPVVNETSLAYVIPNIAPKVIATQVSKEKDKPGIFNVKYQTKDNNGDKLTYKIELKKTNREKWIEIEKDFDKPAYKFNSRTVEDGRYEFKITASDENSNDIATKLSGSRITDVFVVDNTAPEVNIKSVERSQRNLIVDISVSDEFSIIGKVEYTVNSSDDFKSALPVDSVYDTTDEKFKIIIEDLDPGVYLLSFKASDDVENIKYKSVEVIAE